MYRTSVFGSNQGFQPTETVNHTVSVESSLSGTRYRAGMDRSEHLLCLFSAEIRESAGSFTIEVPEREITLGEIEPGETHRVAILPAMARTDTASEPARTRTNQKNDPPVEEGETLDVEIEDVGDQGDGITRVGPGYVVIVPGIDIGDRVTIEITDIRQNMAFAEVLNRHDRS